jgi:AraC-like DNA-binding protein
MRKQEISQEQLAELEAFEKQVTDKATYCRLQCLLLRAKQWLLDQIAEATGYNKRHVQRIQGAYFQEGVSAFERKKREEGGNQRLLPSQIVREYIYA